MQNSFPPFQLVIVSRRAVILAYRFYLLFEATQKKLLAVFFLLFSFIRFEAMYEYNYLPQYEHICRTLSSQKTMLLSQINSPLLTQTRFVSLKDSFSLSLLTNY